MSGVIPSQHAWQRISAAVKRVEARTVSELYRDEARANSVVGAPKVGFVVDDLEYNTFGDIYFADGQTDDFDGNVQPSTRTQRSYNPDLMLWKGARVLFYHCALPNGRGMRANIVQDFSARLIRARAPAGGIPAGGSAVIDRTQITPLDGTYAPVADPTVNLNTEHIAVDGSAIIWCALTLVGTVSVWEIISSDCDSTVAPFGMQWNGDF